MLVNVPGTGSTIVVIEDDPHIASLVELYLSHDGHRVCATADGSRGLELVHREHAALVVLDIGLPGGLDGFEVCRRLRETSDVPVLFLTARDDEMDRVLGLELGADDYVAKPFSPRELAARVRAVLRRTSRAAPGEDQPVDLGGLRVDPARREVHAGESPVDLTTREFELLWWLVRHRGVVLTRRQLLDGAWGADWYGDERTVDVHVAQLRKKLGDALQLATVRGIGYRLG